MQQERFNLGRWLRQNWLEIVLLVVLLLALGWIFRTGAALMPALRPTPEATPTSTPEATIAPTPVPTSVAADGDQAVTPVAPDRLSDSFDGRRAQGYVASQVAFGPRPAGSAAAGATADFVAQELTQLGWDVEQQPFQVGDLQLRNVVAQQGTGPSVLLVAHYDTRPTSDRDPDPERRQLPTLGANDGASGVAVLLELARSLEVDALTNRVILAFLDGEAMGEPRTWAFGSGAAALVGELSETPSAVITLNMVGGQGQQLFYEGTSDAQLRDRLWSLAQTLGYGDSFVPEEGYAVADAPNWNSLGVPVVNLIDLNYPYYHTLDDTPSQISSESLERVGRVLEAFLESR